MGGASIEVGGTDEGLTSGSGGMEGGGREGMEGG